MSNLISVIIPIYNVEKYLEKCIKSVINQTYTNIEIILVNDGSTDKCACICEKYKKIDSRIVIINKENGGLSDARNVGIDVSKGEYLAFIDSDDYVSEDYLEYLYKIICENKVDISVCDFCEVYENENLVNKEEENNIKIFNDAEAIEIMLYQREFDHSAWGKLYRKYLFDNLRFPKGRLFEDIAIMYELINKVNKVGFGSKKNYYYLIRKDSIMNKEFNVKKMDLIEFSKKMVLFIDEKYPDLRKAARRRENISNFNLLRQVLMYNGEYVDVENELISNIKRNSIVVLSDTKAYLRDKVAIIILLFGRKFFKFIWVKYKK